MSSISTIDGKPTLFTAGEPFYLNHSIRTSPFNMTQNHSHNSFEIYYMRAGERFYFIKERSYRVKRGDLVLIPPNVLHKTMQSESPNHERILINFKQSFIEGFFDELAPGALDIFEDGPVLHLDPHALNMIESIMEKMLWEQKHQEPDAVAYMKVFLSELLLLINRHIRHTDRKHKIAEHPTTLHRKVSDIVRHINENFHQPLSLKLLADHFHISSFYLCRIYKEVTGFTVIEYVNQLRVQEAQKLLKTTRLSVTEITEKVGFESSTHFGRIFKSLCGMSPLQYRKWNGSNG